MVAIFHLHYLGHKIKYGNLEVGNYCQKLLYIYIYIYLYTSKVSYIHCFLLFSTVMLFFALHTRHFEIRKNIL